MADKRAYFKLDVGYLSNPKVSALLDEHPRAILLHLECIAYSAQHLTDGLVPMRMAMRLACAEQCDLDLLLRCGLLECVNETQVLVHDYLEHQRSASETKTASEQGKRAAQARWTNAGRNASSMPDALRNPMPREREERDTTTCASAHAERDAIDRDFDEWYDLYPLKKSKGQAIKAYRTARKKVDAATILNGLRQQLPELTSREPSKRPYPATWLNGERWADEDASNVHQMPQRGEMNPADRWQMPEPPADVADDPALYQEWLAEQRKAAGR